MTVRLTHAEDVFPLQGVFRISRGARTESRAVSVTLADGALVARGECMPYARYGETVESVRAQIESVAAAVADGADRMAAQDLLPPGAARNAVDCAFWDLEAKRAGKRASLSSRSPAASKAPGPPIRPSGTTAISTCCSAMTGISPRARPVPGSGCP